MRSAERVYMATSGCVSSFKLEVSSRRLDLTYASLLRRLPPFSTGLKPIASRLPVMQDHIQLSLPFQDRLVSRRRLDRVRPSRKLERRSVLMARNDGTSSLLDLADMLLTERERRMRGIRRITSGRLACL